MQLHTSVYSSVLKLWYEESAKVWSHEESFCCTTKHCMYNLRKLWTNLAYRSCYTLQGCIQPRLGNQWLLFFRLMKRKLQGQKFFWSAVGCSSVAQTVSQQPESIFALDKKRAFSWSSVFIWNSIPLSVRNAPTISTFKRRLKTFYFSSISS